MSLDLVGVEKIWKYWQVWRLIVQISEKLLSFWTCMSETLDIHVLSLKIRSLTLGVYIESLDAYMGSLALASQTLNAYVGNLALTGQISPAYVRSMLTQAVCKTSSNICNFNCEFMWLMLGVIS